MATKKGEITVLIVDDHPLFRQGVVDGKSNNEIANLLGINHLTGKNQVTSILRKFGVEDRTQAVGYAL
ncbi:MAG: hypothetical protein A2X25_01940 [Chloroflexi bacterium GWB2_49_20]|nr:MAG: hypothetical protein A2X25_01940 [Chloroflexi bacterium GWB2_49_20]OGN78207.1 MAG: hypothetical protein A2X26_14545 [Chloroflexi bacterium GWC2_49_37]OGN85243.1 MAG: hypothetical protein A2X27_07200 [Chloroflexi bacterium GWD2_49_16]